MKQCHVRKFVSFLSKNFDAPFKVKQTVWQSCVNSAILYSCESWMVKDLTPIQTQYLTTAKDLLGVRSQTPNDLVYVELNVPSVQSLVKKRQITFLQSVRNSPHYDGSPLQKAIGLAKDANSPMGLYIKELESVTTDPVDDFARHVKLKVTNSDSSRCVTYNSINPDMSVHPLYNANVKEQHRIDTTGRPNKNETQI